MTTSLTGRGPLPAELTSFVGRRRELSETRRLLAASRMLTLTGAGGVGKTRLALRMAAEVRRTFPDGVWFVELAPLRDPHLLPHTVANTLGLRQVSADPAADLVTYLEDRRLLIVLDNCEHLTEACAVLVSKLLAAAPEVRILATSRHLLGVEGEQILAVPPLSVPDEAVPAGDATHYESVQLFLDRAAAVAPGFAVTDSNRAAVLELCRRLDGMPLAIELAAVWLRVLTPAQMLERLDDRFRLLAYDRPGAPVGRQTLDATVGWSYELCSPAEQELWARLSVFSGGFDLEAAEDVCSGDGIEREDVLELIANLVNKSIIVRHQATDTTTAWYEMLEIVRQYGAARLGQDRIRALRKRHRDHYRALAARFGAECFSLRQADWYLRLRREHDNLRAALDSCLADPGEAGPALEIAAPLWIFWLTGFLREGHRYLTRALDLATEPTPVRGTALWAVAYLAMVAGDFDEMDTRLAEAVELAERFDDELLRARILECRGHAQLYLDLPTGIALLEEARTSYRRLGFEFGEFNTLVLLAAGMFFLDDPRDEELSRQALDLAERQGALSSQAYALWCKGMARWRAGDYGQAVEHLRQCVRFFRPLRDLTGIGFAVQGLSWCAASRSPDESAARILGASQAVWRASGARIDETNPYVLFDQRAEAALRKSLGNERFEQAFAEGASYSWEQAVALALGEGGTASAEPGAAAAPPWGEPAGGLTPREREIAGLVAEGLSNRDIASRVVISQRTVETHVDHILSKLGMTSRTQVASWVAEHRAR